MKIYVSEKEIDNNNLNYVVEDWYEEYWLLKGNKEENGFEIHDDVGLVEIQSLEQHDRELLREFADKILEIWYDEKVTQIDGDLYKFTERAELIARGYNGCREQVEQKINELLKERGVEC